MPCEFVGGVPTFWGNTASILGPEDGCSSKTLVPWYPSTSPYSITSQKTAIEKTEEAERILLALTNGSDNARNKVIRTIRAVLCSSSEWQIINKYTFPL
jgi:hypothetical protein